jgi:hypothetical protein
MKKVILSILLLIPICLGMNTCNNRLVESSRIQRINDRTVQSYSRHRLINKFVDEKIHYMKNSKFAGHSSVGVAGGGDLYKEIYKHAETVFPEGRSYGSSVSENTSYDDKWEVAYKGRRYPYKYFYMRTK